MRASCPSLLVLVLTLAACGGDERTATLTPDEVAAEIDAIAGDLVARGRVAGISVAVVKDGREVLARGWGVADRASGAPASADTRYRILSISKQVTAVALLRLVQAGKLSLDDRIGAFFPDLGSAGDAITVRHLLTHTSGLPELWQVPGWEDADTTAEMIALYAGRPTVTAPGQAFAYRNVNFVFAGVIVEEVSGEALSAHLARTLFAPLGMTSTDFCEGLTTRGYLPGLGAAPLLALAPDEGSASLCSTVRDLGIWEAAYDDGRLLDDNLTAASRARTTLSGGSSVAYGMGVDLSLGGVRDTVGHGGSGDGWIASLVHDMAADLTVIILSNTSAPEIATARAQITAAALALP